jgi:hypothetical protein
MSGGGAGLIDAAGVPLIRLLSEECGLRPGLSKALARPGFVSGHDRGQVLIDAAIGLIMGARSVRGVTGALSGSQHVTGPTASAPTMWRMFEELDQNALDQVMKARAVHRRAIWTRLTERAAGFPWVEVAGHVWDGWLIIDVDANLVECHSDKEGAAPTFKRHIFDLYPLVVTLANTGEVLAISLRKGYAGSNTAEDHLHVLR